MNRKIFTVLLMICMFAAITPAISYANHEKGSSGSKHYNLEDKFFKQAHKILKLNRELELSDEQIKEIKALKKQVKKDLVKQDADIETLKVEINSLMWEAPLSLEETNALVDQKYELKKKKAKYLVASYDKLNKLLTKEQLDDLSKTF